MISSFFESKNMIPELISDQQYFILVKYGLLNKTKVRNYLIRKRYKELRDQKVKAGECIDMILLDYPYLTFDTIKHILSST